MTEGVSVSLGKRLRSLFDGGREQDPHEVLDASYDKQLALLQQTRRGAADVATSRMRLELQLRQLEGRADALHDEATELVRAGQDERARVLLVQRAALTEQIDELAPQERSLREQEGALQVGVQRLEAKVEAFRSQKESLAAGFTAAEARNRIGQAMAGVDEELGDVGMAVQRARDRTEAMQARAGAMEELAEINQPNLSPGDAALRQLERLQGATAVDDELARLKTALPPASPPQATT